MGGCICGHHEEMGDHRNRPSRIDRKLNPGDNKISHCNTLATGSSTIDQTQSYHRTPKKYLLLLDPKANPLYSSRAKNRKPSSSF